MATVLEGIGSPAADGQKTNKTSAIRSFIHKRTLSKGAALTQRPTVDLAKSPTDHRSLVILPAHHPTSQPLGELRSSQQNEMPPSPTKTRDGGRPNMGHKKSFSAISLKGLGIDPRKSASKGDKEPRLASPKKTKSSTNLADLLSRPKSSKNLKKKAMEQEEENARQVKDKENTTPTRSDDNVSRPPIYAQFSSEFFNKQPLGGKFLEDHVDLYTPQQYNPNQQRNFYAGPNDQPRISQDVSRRPKSTYLPSAYSLKDISRQNSSARKSFDEPRSQLVGIPDWNSPSKRNTYQPTGPGYRSQESSSTIPSFGSKSSYASTDVSVDLKEVDLALEALLDRRNIPEDQRHKMRNVALSVKISLIKHDKEEMEGLAAPTPPSKDKPDSPVEDAADPKTPELKKRPRSRTFTLSRSSKDATSPTKKSKPESSAGKQHARTKSSDSVVMPITGTGSSVANNLIAKAKGQTPKDFVTYLQKVQKPEVLEVGRMQKLRQLLRNEKIGWTDEFINLGGMKEIVELLHRIMEVEWREEHEDTLLHSTLLCLKALCTTTLGQAYLDEVQTTLFPALIHLIFDEEKKGPSEFITRNIITWLLFTYLKCAPLSERVFRAKTILSYLKDPTKGEDERPVGFVLEMHRDRPYRVWCKEVVNVTKEVFWIFLHNLNVISMPAIPSSSSSTGSGNLASIPKEDEAKSVHHYALSYFPTEAPPVPAAPYVGSVEWDATNYLSSHLDLLNGIIASLPTLAERNTLRDQLRISGWERAMGGTLRLCKEKFYGSVHAALRCWVAAAVADGWEVTDVRCGPRDDSPKKFRASPKKKVEKAPVIEMPKLDFGNGNKMSYGDAWL